jgi:hypothetical protein
MAWVQHHISGASLRWCRAISAPSRQTTSSLGGEPDPDSAAGQSPGEPNSRHPHPHNPVALDPALGPYIDIGQRIGRPMEEPALGSQRVDDPAADPAMVATPGHLLGPGVRLGLQVAEIYKGP